MRRFTVLFGVVVFVAFAMSSVASACGDKFLAPGHVPGACALSRPPREIAILIYGDPSSDAVSAVSSSEYRKTLALSGYKVTMCENSTDCISEMKNKKFDVILADAKDAHALKEQTGSNVVPVLLKASKAEVQEARQAYGQVFDASAGSLHLLPVINRAAQKPR